MRRSSYLHSIRGNKTHRSKPRCQIIEPALMLIVQIDLLSFAAMWPVSWRNQTHLTDRTIQDHEIICVKEYCGSKPAKYVPHNTINSIFLKVIKLWQTGVSDLVWLSLCTFLILLTFVTSPFIFPFSHFKTDFFVHFQIYYLSFPWFTFFLYFLFYFFQSFSKAFFLLLIARLRSDSTEMVASDIASGESPTLAPNAIGPKLSLIHLDGLSCTNNSEWISLAKLINDTEF